MLVGDIKSISDVSKMGDVDWSTQCLGSFYVKPNYPGRSSHVCNAGFLVTAARRNAGVGKLLAQAYLEWAPKLVSVKCMIAGRVTDVSTGLYIFGVQLGL